MMSRLKKISWTLQGIGILGCLIFIWRVIDWQFIQGAPSAMGNLEILGPVLGFLISASILLFGLLLLGVAWLYRFFKPTP